MGLKEETAGMDKFNILVVDDEELLRNLIVTCLLKLGHSCETAIDGLDALGKMKQDKFDAVITDVRMPRMDGINLTREILIRCPGPPVMVMTAYDEEYTAGTALSAGAREFIKKPFSISEFVIRLHKMIHDSQALNRAMTVKKDGEEDLDELKNKLTNILK